MGTVSAAIQGTILVAKRLVKIAGIVPIMFDRYPGDNDTKLETWQKLYLGGENGNIVGLPATNIMSFLSAQNTVSAPKRLLGKKHKAFCLAAQSFVMIQPDFIPFTRNGKPIELGSKLEGGKTDKESGIYVNYAVARLPKGIPNVKVRPVLPLPWELEFVLSILPNKEIQETQVANILKDGLLALGLGTWRGSFGKGIIIEWSEIKD